jgi:hypothetical protein
LREQAFNGPIHAPDNWWQPALALDKGSQAWLVVEPKDGKIPPLTPEAEKRRRARRRTRRRGQGRFELEHALSPPRSRARASIATVASPAKAPKSKPANHVFRVGNDTVRAEYRRERSAAIRDRLVRREALAPALAERAVVALRRDDGYAIVPEGALDLAAAVHFAERVAAEVDLEKKKAEANKPFMVKLAEMSAMTLESPLLQLALNPGVLGAAAGYLGMVPILEYANVAYSSDTGEDLAKSQLYHCDSDEGEQVKMFVLCAPVTPETGPLTFLSAGRSQTVRDHAKYAYKHRLTDEQVTAALGSLDEEVALTGKAGTAAFIDTSRCLHYGSRFADRAATRLVIMLQYVTPLAFLYPDDHRTTARFRHLATPAQDEVTRLVLGAA